MKIKEVAKKTGLTEKSIRFYEEKGLIQPEIKYVANRKFREYSEEDVKELNTIMYLRKGYFSIEEIKRMKESPEDIISILKQYQERLQEEVVVKKEIMKALAMPHNNEEMSADQLANLLAPITKENPLPKSDVKPNFIKLDRQNNEVNLLVNKRIYTRFSIMPKRISGYEILILATLWNVGDVTFNDLAHVCTKRGLTDILLVEKLLRKMKHRGLITKKGNVYRAKVDKIKIESKDIEKLALGPVIGTQDLFVFDGRQPAGVNSQGITMM